MTTPRLRATSPPGQDDIGHYAGKVLGKCRTTSGIEIALCKWDGKLVLIRPSAGTRRGTEEDIAAIVTHADGEATIAWNEWHEETRPEYMPQVEAWTRRQLGVGS